tara:strand:+ start:62 stop:310 length:249 start_codon:yes stop_codon:yes gene_type:complete
MILLRKGERKQLQEGGGKNKMAVRLDKTIKRTRIYQKPDGNWKATIGFKNEYTRKGSSETFETKYDAQDWVKGIKAFKRRKK